MVGDVKKWLRWLEVVGDVKKWLGRVREGLPHYYDKWNPHPGGQLRSKISGERGSIRSSYTMQSCTPSSKLTYIGLYAVNEVDEADETMLNPITHAHSNLRDDHVIHRTPAHPSSRL